MRWFCSKFRLRNSRQQWIPLLLLAGLFAALMPVPVSLVRSADQKDRSEPFPCQDRPCACRSAAQCKKQCCCFTPDQKRAWGRRHGVKAFAIPVETAASRPRPAAARLACCESLPVTEAASPATKDAVPQKSESTARKSPKSSSRIKLVIGLFAQQCQGVSHSLSGVPFYIAPPRVELVTVVAQTFERLILGPVQFEQGAVEPPVPPPRLTGV